MRVRPKVLDKPTILPPPLLGWSPPPYQWIKINTNGFIAACGGIARDHNGKLIVAWSLTLGLCTITAVELWAIF